MKPLLLVTIPLAQAHIDHIRASFDVIHAPTVSAKAQAIASQGDQVRAVLTNGAAGLSAADIAGLPALSLVCALGAGHENIDLGAARARGIVTANGADTNADCVADHAFALLLAVVRAVPALDSACRQGVWRDDLPLCPNFSGKRLGILGLGTIGAKMARRGLAFDLDVGYHNRRPREGTPHAYFDSPHALAAWADYLVVATPGGASNRHLVDADVLAALGPAGFLVNIARGSVVDTQALADALRDGRIAGAGLDVYESEPAPPELLFGLPNVVLTPHIAGWSPEAIDNSVGRFIENARRHFNGEAPVSPI